MKRSCLRCGVTFEPRKAGHVFCRPECRHLGPRHPDEPVPAPPFDAAAVARLTDGPGGEALLRRALRLFGPAGGRERSTLIAAVLREHGDKVVRELCEDALARMGSDESSAFERIATEEGAGAYAVLELLPEYFAPGWAPFPTGNERAAEMDRTVARLREERER